MSWAEVLEDTPHPKVVTDANLRAAIQATGLPWRVRDRRSKIEMLLVPPGSYKRGASPGDNEADANESPAHDVQITKAFYLGRYEVMESEWKRVKDNFDGPLALGTPQKKVSHDDVVRWLTKAPGLRLPTEAEWEYACRAGTTGARYGDVNSVAVYTDNSGGSVARVGTKQSNALGFYDMLGNVGELCSDWYDSYDSLRSGVSDPQGPASKYYRVVRGGSFAGSDSTCRASSRYNDGPASRNGFVGFGFRVSRTP
jgi:formylglycine-generating enzyme required for sulfatase activity